MTSEEEESVASPALYFQNIHSSEEPTVFEIKNKNGVKEPAKKPTNKLVGFK